MKKALISAILCFVVIGAGVGIVRFTGALNDSVADGATMNAGTASPKLARVVVREVRAERLEDAVMLTGKTAPWEELVLSAETRGRVEWQGVKKGELAKKGQELFRIDTDSMGARLDQAKAQRTLADQEFERIERLTGSGGVSKQERDRATADQAVADANVRVAELELAKSSVRAPFSGVVDAVLTKQGEFADTGTPLVRLMQIDRIKAVVGLPERLVPAFAEGDKVALTLDALPGRTFAGTIHWIATSGDRNTHTFRTEISIANTDGLIKPGMTVRARMVRNVFEEAIVVPIFTILSIKDGQYVFVEHDGVAELRLIEMGIYQGKNVQITKGLDAGDRVIVKGQRELSDGESVQIHEAL